MRETGLAAALLVVVAAFLVLPLQAEAQTVETLVNNLSEATSAHTIVGGDNNVRQAQKFTVPTGQNYSLADVTISVSTRGSDGIVVSIRDGSAADPPDTALYTLIDPTSPGTGNQVYSAPAGAVLEGGNSYFVMLERAQFTGTSSAVAGTNANGQSGETGWSIANDRRERSGSSWSNRTHALKIRIRGSFSTYAAPPTHREIWSATLTVAEISVSGSTFGYGFLDSTNAGSLSEEEFTYYGTDYSILLFYNTTDTDPDLWLGLNPSGETAFDNEELSLVVDGTAFSFGDAVHNSTRQWVWAESGLNWADGDRVAVRLLGPLPPPVALVSATVSGTALTLTYDTGMDETSVPAASAYAVDVDGTAATVSSVAVAGAEVTLTLASAPAATATTTVGYVVPATNPLRSLPAAIVPTFSDQPVAHVVNLVKNRSQAASLVQGLVGTSSGMAYAVAQQFGTGGNAAGYLLASVVLDVDGVEANTDPRVSIYTKSGSNPGTLVHTLANPSSVADGWRTFTAPPGALLGKDTDYFVVVEHTHTTETFTIGLTTSDAEDSGKAAGWGIANTRRRSVDGTWGAISSSDVVRIQVQGAITPNRLATGAPAITGPAAVGQTLAAATAGISDPDGTTKAEAGDTGYAYTYQWIRVDSDGSSNATDISGATASTYVLASADEGKKIKVEVELTDDADSDEGPLTSAAYPPTGTVAAGATNADPVFMDGASTSRDFNETIGDAAVTTASNIGTAVGATDTDTGDTLEYTLSGTDAAKFGIINTSGQIQTKVGEKYSYETDTSYSVTVTVVDGNGGSDSIDVTLDVADQDEPPLRPVAPEVNGHSTDVTKLLLTLTRPDSTDRPNISGYQVRLHGPGSGWSVLDWVTGVNRTIAGANSGVRYTVQYRARNDEGESQWSPSGFGSTRAHATGMPDITGTAEVGQTLTAGTSGISDGNGKSKAENGDVGFAYTYQWVRRVGGTDSNISGATSSTYTLASADEGNKVKVKARFTDNAGYAEGPLTSSAYPATGTVAPQPAPELSYANGNITVGENAGPATLTVELDRASTGTVTVDFATSDLGMLSTHATAGEDYTATSGTLTFTSGQTSKTITIAILNDTDYEPLERFRVTLSNASGATLPTSPWAQVNITSDEAVPTASLENVTVDEGAGTMTLTLRLSHPSQADIAYVVNASNVAGTATQDDDYDDFLLQAARTAKITVPGGELTQTFDITIVDDSVDEPDETIIIGWQKVTGAEVTPGTITFTGTIADNDTAAGVTLSKSTLTVTEEDAAGDSYTLVLRSQPTANVVVTVAGHAGTDVTVNPTTLTFTSTTWNTPQPVTVTAADDADTVNDTVSLTHSAASSDANYSGIMIAGVAVTVSDNDGSNNAPVFDDGASTTRTLSETGGSTPLTIGSPVGHPVAASDADNDPLEYRLEGADAGRFTVALGTGQIRTLANTVYDYEVRQSYSVVVNVEDGNGASETIDVTLEVENQLETPRTVSQPTVTTLGTTSLRVNWTAPENVGRPAITGYVVRHVKAGVDDSATQRVTGTSETLTGLEPDTRYFVYVRAVNADGPSTNWSIARIVNTAPVLVTFGASSYTATEGGAAATVTVALSEAVGSSTTIPLTPTNRGGATDADYSGVPPNVTFGGSQTSTTFTVTAVDDSDNDRGESVRIGFGVLPSGLAAGSPATATVVLDDDDSWVPPTVSFGAATYTATEGGGAVTVTVEVDRLEVPFTLSLTRAAQGGATSSDYSGVPTSVVFGEFDRVKSFTVTAVDDEADDDGESVVIGFGAPLPAGLSLRIGSPSEATVRLVDNDVPAASGALRLVGGDGSYGRLQVYHDGQWGLVCEGNFGREEAQVACRQLGFADGEEGFGGAGSGGLPVWLKGVQCVGTESRLVDCQHRGLQQHYCGSFDITGVECSQTLLSMADARVDGPLLTVRYNAALDGGWRPSAGDFVVLAGSAGAAAAAAVPVTAVSVDGDAVALTLARAVPAGRDGTPELPGRADAPAAGPVGHRCGGADGHGGAQRDARRGGHGVRGLVAAHRCWRAGRVAAILSAAARQGGAAGPVAPEPLRAVRACRADGCAGTEPRGQRGRGSGAAVGPDRPARARPVVECDRGPDSARRADRPQAPGPVGQPHRGRLGVVGTDGPGGAAPGRQPRRRRAAAVAPAAAGQSGTVGQPHRRHPAAGGTGRAEAPGPVGERGIRHLPAGEPVRTGVAAAAWEPDLGRRAAGPTDASALAVAGRGRRRDRTAGRGRARGVALGRMGGVTGREDVDSAGLTGPTGAGCATNPCEWTPTVALVRL